MKASLHLVQESMLFLGKDNNQSLALPLKEKGKNLSLTKSPYTSLYFCISQSSTKLFKRAAASSVLTPENCSFITKVNRAGLISKKSTLEADGAIGVQIKSLLLVLVKSHNLVFSGLLILASLKQATGQFEMVN